MNKSLQIKPLIGCVLLFLVLINDLEIVARGHQCKVQINEKLSSTWLKWRSHDGGRLVVPIRSN